MKVLLVNPNWQSKVSKKGKRFNRAFPPLDLMYCAAILEENGISVQICDANATGDSGKTAAENADDYDRIIITSTPYYKWQCPNLDFETFLDFLAPFPKDNLYLYGAHCSLFPVEVLKTSNVAGLITGQPEPAILDLCKKEKSRVPALVYRDGDRILSNPMSSQTDLDSLPMPAYHLVKDYAYRYDILGDRLMVFEGARGCPFKCIFCLQTMYNNTYRRKSPEKLIREVDRAVSQYGTKTGYFYDENFVSNKQMVGQLCEHLINKDCGFRWTCQTRPDSPDPGIFKLIKRAGCTLVHFGVESGSQKVLDTIGKRILVEDIKRTIGAAQQAGLRTVCFFMFGFPGEKSEDIEATIRLAIELNPTYASFHVAAPYPGTPFFQSVVSNPAPLHFPQAYTGEYSLSELEKTARKAFCSFYLRPVYLVGRLAGMRPSAIWRNLRLFLDFIK